MHMTNNTPGADAGATLEAEVREATRRYRVPEELVLAMGYVNTRLEMPAPEAAAYAPGEPHGSGLYGIMALVRNPSSDTLGEASRLTGLPEADLKADRRSNILGGAALLAESQGDARPSTLGGWLGAVSGDGGEGRRYETIAGVGGGPLYAEQVIDVLRNGASADLAGGGRVTLPARDLEAPWSPNG
jgi:hypothetical protein